MMCTLVKGKSVNVNYTIGYKTQLNLLINQTKYNALVFFYQIIINILNNYQKNRQVLIANKYAIKYPQAGSLPYSLNATHTHCR